MNWVAFAGVVVAGISIIAVRLEHRQDRVEAVRRQLRDEVARARDWAVPTLVRARNMLDTWSPERTRDIVDVFATDGSELEKQLAFLEREWGSVGDGLSTIESGHPNKGVRDRVENVRSTVSGYLLKVEEILQVAFITCDNEEAAARNEYEPQLDKARRLLVAAQQSLSDFTDMLHPAPDPEPPAAWWQFWMRWRA